MHSREAWSKQREKWVGSLSEEGKGQTAGWGGGGRKGQAANRKGQGTPGPGLEAPWPSPLWAGQRGGGLQ